VSLTAAGRLFHAIDAVIRETRGLPELTDGLTVLRAWVTRRTEGDGELRRRCLSEETQRGMMALCREDVDTMALLINNRPLLRPFNDSRDNFFFCVCLFYMKTLIFQAAERRRGPVKSILDVCFEAELLKFTHSRHFAHPSPTFYSGSKVRNFASSFLTSRLWRIVVLKRGKISNIYATIINNTHKLSSVTFICSTQERSRRLQE